MAVDSTKPISFILVLNYMGLPGGHKRAMLIALSGLSVGLIAYFTILCQRRAATNTNGGSGSGSLGAHTSRRVSRCAVVMIYVGLCTSILVQPGPEHVLRPRLLPPFDWNTCCLVPLPSGININRVLLLHRRGRRCRRCGVDLLRG